jgi:hypothetical protein
VLLRRCIVVCLAVLTGCATAPYHRPPASATLGERQEIYKEKSMSYHWFGGFRVGRKPFHYPSHYPVSNQFASYFSMGGDEEAAEMARGATPYYWLAFALGIGGATAGIIAFQSNPSADESWFLGPALVGLGGEVLSIEWANHHFIRRAADNYNAYLRKDLGLPETVTTTAVAKP